MRALVGLLLAFVCVDCTTPATEVIVLVGSDVPGDVPMQVRVAVRRGATAIPGGGDDRVWSRDGTLDGGASITLPASFAIVPAAGEPRDDEVTLRVTGAVAGLTLTRTVRFRFVPRTPSTLRVFLTLRCLLRDRQCTSGPCDRSTFCRLANQDCGDDGNCTAIEQTPVPGTIPSPFPQFDASGLCVANRECPSGFACVGSRCMPCVCPPANACQQSVRCADDGAGTCVATNRTDGTACDDGDACTFGDACRAGTCSGTPLTCASDACTMRSCNGTASCTTTPLGALVYESQAGGWTYTYGSGGTAVFRTPVQDQTLYLLGSMIGDRMLSAQMDEANTCDWCACASACQYSPTGITIGVASTTMPGMVALERYVETSPMVAHRAAINDPGPPFMPDRALGFVCPP